MTKQRNERNRRGGERAGAATKLRAPYVRLRARARERAERAGRRSGDQARPKRVRWSTSGSTAPPVARDAEYLRQLTAEEEFWDRPRFISALEPPLPQRQYLNERFTGDSRTEWSETIQRYGTFERGCALGTGILKNEAQILRDNPSLRLTFIDISGECLAEREEKLGARFPGRVATHQADLNFVELPRNAYDLIVSDGSMHHFLNLEHIASQINQSLTQEGFFFLHDYVGEARFQFTEEKKRLFEAVFREAQGDHGSLRSWQVVWPDLDDWTHSPFEATRSDETLDVLRQRLTEVSVRTCGALATLMLFVKPKPRGLLRRSNRRTVRSRLRALLVRLRMPVGAYPRPNEKALERWVLPGLLKVDRLVSEADLFQPCRTFAVYRKSPAGWRVGGRSPSSSSRPSSSSAG